MDYMQQIKTDMYNITNEVRLGFGLRSVIYSNELDRMGQIHTNEMYTYKFFLHENPYCKIVESLADRVQYCGLAGKYKMVGENLADYPAEHGMININPITRLFNENFNLTLKTSQQLCREIIKGWYNSPGHKVNLLCPDYDSVGFGLLLYPKICHGIRIKYLLVTQNFGKTIIKKTYDNQVYFNIDFH